MNRGYDINRGHYLKRVVINIRASKNTSGLVKILVTSPAGLMKFFLNVEPWVYKNLCLLVLWRKAAAALKWLTEANLTIRLTSHLLMNVDDTSIQ